MDEETKLVFHIIHGSFVDGYGCRTTVFLKGCPLRCKWCCNPESQNEYLEIKLVEDAACTGCGKCEQVCPTGAVSVSKTNHKNVQNTDNGLDEAVRINRGKCIHCGKCAEACLTGKIETFGKPYTVDELFEIIKKDEVQYQATGGGVSIGGGEAAMHGRFTLDLIRKCKENYIQTALDTCGYITKKEGLQALEEADYALFDIKGMDPVLHKENTGVDNKLILENLERRNTLGKPVIIRVPVIPNFNDMPEELNAIAKYLSTLRVIERVDLIPFHDYCRVKYKQLGRTYPIPETTRPISNEEEDILLHRFLKYGLNAQIGG